MAIRCVLSGQIYVSDEMTRKMIRSHVRGRPEPGGSLLERLSDRELEVFELIGRGMTTRQIAKALHLSIKTVEAHRARIKKKLSLSNATELLRHAMHWVASEGREQ